MAEEDIKNTKKIIIDANKNSFKDLCESLQNEQSRLRALEERRLQLSQNMNLLRQQLDEENKAYKKILAETGVDKSAAQSKDEPGCSKIQKPTQAKNVSMSMDQKYSVTPLEFKVLELADKDILAKDLVNEATGSIGVKAVLETALESKFEETVDVKISTPEQVD